MKFDQSDKVSELISLETDPYRFTCIILKMSRLFILRISFENEKSMNKDLSNE